jgi:hypothetical protein
VYPVAPKRTILPVIVGIKSTCLKLGRMFTVLTLHE